MCFAVRVGYYGCWCLVCGDCLLYVDVISAISGLFVGLVVVVGFVSSLLCCWGVLLAECFVVLMA